MKFSVSISAVAIALITTIGGVSSAMALEAYKTNKDQVVFTGLKAKKKYDVQYKNATGRHGQRKVDANSCGEALISKAGKFQSVTIDGQSIDPKTLAIKEHQRCAPGKKKISKKRTISPKALVSPPASAAPGAGK
jgi:hypothetical protein